MTVALMSDKSVWVYDGLVTPEIIAIIKGHAGSVYDIGLTAEGKIITGSHDKTIREWDIAFESDGMLRSVDQTKVGVLYDTFDHLKKR